MSQLFSTPEDPWALPTPKQWDSEHATTMDSDPLRSEDQDDGEDEQEQTTSVTSSGGAINNNLEGSIWDDGNSILGNGSSGSGNPIDDSVDNNNAFAGSSDFHAWSEAVRKTYSAISSDFITIVEMEERQGLLFKHTNYLIEHHVQLEGESDTTSSGDRKVVRRYSDFVWLLEVLLKRYTFRLVPELPPKKLASGSDPLFLERRRKGLSRFLNAVVRHPILRAEPLLVMFLTVPTDLSGWRRQAQYDTSEEFLDRKCPTQFISMWESSKLEIEDIVSSAEEELKVAIDYWNKVCIVIERLCVRQRQMAADQERLSSLLTKFKESAFVIYPVEETRMPQISEGLRETSKYLTNSVKITLDEAQSGDEKILEEFKRHLDYLFTMKTLFDRYHRLGGNSIDHLSKRKEHNEQKLAELQGKPDARGTEVDRVTDAIASDEKEISRQTNRCWLIKENVLTEFVMFQETQFQITRALKHWSHDRLSFTENHMDNWTGLSSVLQDMPLTRSV